MRFHLRPLGVRQNESIHQKLESHQASKGNPDSQQTLGRGWGLGYGVVEAVVEAIVGTTLVGTIGGATVHDLVNCIGVVGVVKPLSCAVLFVRIGRGHSNSF